MRHILTEALLRLAEEDQQSEMEQQMASILVALNEIRTRLEQLQLRGVVETNKHEPKSEEKVSDAFILSVKMTAKPGVQL